MNINMISDELKYSLVVRLTGLGRGQVQPLNKRSGICEEIQIVCMGLDCDNNDFEDVLCSIQGVWASWPKFSGDLIFPVPAGYKEEKYYKDIPQGVPQAVYTKEHNLWAENEYGNNRRELCLYLADRLISLGK